MGSGASKKESDDDQEIDTGEFEPIKNWQGEVSTRHSEDRQCSGLLGRRWDKRFINQASDVPSITIFSYNLAKFFPKTLSINFSIFL